MMLRPDHLQTLRDSSSSTSKMTIIEAVDGMQNNQIDIAMIISYTDTEVTLVVLSSFVRPIPLRMYSFSSAWKSILRFGEFGRSQFRFPQEPILNAVQTVQECPKTHSVFMRKECLPSSH